jgi:predicted phosphodiesterase
VSGPERLRLFAVEDTTVQVTWGHLPAQEVRVRAGDAELVVAHPGGPAAPVLEGLEADRSVEVELTGDGWRRTLRTRTLAPPPGEELHRFATMSDLHLGLDVFGFLGTMREAPEPAEPHTTRCTRAAMHEARAWGADRLVLKGDTTESGAIAEWEQLGELLAEVELPAEVLPGNHDARRRREIDPDDAFERLGLTPLDGARAVDLPGLRLVLFDTTTSGHHGHYRSDDVVELVEGADRPVILVGHHHPMPLPFLSYWPPGVPSHRARRFFRQISAVRPDAVYLAGHTHRHRRYEVGGVQVVEVGSPKDFPGTWGGYVVHEGGFRQVVRRVQDPECLPWLERSRRAAWGAWGLWSPGGLDARCYTHPWVGTASGDDASGGGAVQEGGHRLAADRG